MAGALAKALKSTSALKLSPPSTWLASRSFLARPCLLKEAAAEGSTGPRGSLKDVDHIPSTGLKKDIAYWKPDGNGTWIPIYKAGSEGVEEEVEVPGVRRRDIARASMDERAWWSSLEEMPERASRI